ncbi:hypothetical protein C4D60_Mb11t11970 [Musa balbisiana]|uniref:Uncharacterized protein n=1 Tax=Musa balbisiana TaxID=52838 RepID=A0A4S8J3H3_MUSBA|nr:hypothetical protein C4D60_Mb11t11970 [Musa balbisiana]
MTIAVSAGALSALISSLGSPLIRGSVRLALEEGQPVLAPRPPSSRPLDLMLGGSSRRRLRVLVLHSVSVSKRILGIEMFRSLLVDLFISDRVFSVKLFHSLEQTSAGAVALTDIVFWGLLVPFLSVEHFKLDLLMGCMHSLNFVFLLLDTALNSLPFPWFRMAYFVLWSCIYVIFQWILHACGFSWWPYRFLELSTPWAPLWYFCLALLHVPCYGLYSLLVTAKNTLFPKFFHTRP